MEMKYEESVCFAAAASDVQYTVQYCTTVRYTQLAVPQRDRYELCSHLSTVEPGWFRLDS